MKYDDVDCRLNDEAVWIPDLQQIGYQRATVDGLVYLRCLGCKKIVHQWPVDNRAFQHFSHYCPARDSTVGLPGLPLMPEFAIERERTTESLVHIAAFASYFASEVARRMDNGYGPPTDEQMERYAEEAKTVADDAARLYIEVTKAK